MKESWDLIVAGAGPAGCALAGKVARRGAKVLLLEKEQEPGLGRDWVVDVARGTFEDAEVPEPSPAARWNEPASTVLVSSDTAHVIELPPSPLLPVRNGLYVGELADWAVAGGARLRAGCTAKGAVVERDAVRGVTFSGRDGKEYTAEGPLVADCTGMPGVLRRSTPGAWGMAAPVGETETVLARREVWKIDRKAARKEVEAGRASDGRRVDRAGAYGVYSIQTCYLDIKGGFVDVLVGVKPGSGRKGADGLFEEYMAGLPYATEKIFGDGGPIPIRRLLSSPVCDGMLVLGDSACQVVPAHGSGTASALLAADLAAGTVLEALRRDEYGRAVLWEYAHAFMSGRGAVLAYYDVLRLHTDNITVRDLDRLIEKGVLDADLVYSGLLPEPPALRPSRLARQAYRGLASPLQLIGFSLAGLKAERTRRHYRRYPESWSPESFASWEQRIP
ncbi:MAG: FAD-binding protein [Actinobacteria bacterium]|nr:FAD-binding protein [Actinomycetota bacterium]MBU1942869.1 FAD-binding protein [Actinomycetota bacterium]MBU2687601.1 FAD-binding protein [Actinomycetota bacterium]